MNTESWTAWQRDWTTAMHYSDKTADSTARTYERGLRQFIDYLAAHHPDATEPDRVTRPMVRGWLDSMTDAGKSPATRRVRLMTLRSFYEWLRREPGSGFTEDSPLPTSHVDAPTVDPEQQSAGRPPVDADTMRKLLRTCRARTFVDLRDEAILRTLYSTGLRRAELCSVDIDDVDLNRAALVVAHGKGGKRRTVALSSSTVLAISRYVRLRRRQPGAGDAALFLSTRPTGGRWRMTGGAIAELLSRRCARAGVPTIVPHQLRHTWAHEVKRAGMSNEDMDRMAGWSPSSNMSRRYGSAVAEERAGEALRRLGVGDDL